MNTTDPFALRPAAPSDEGFLFELYASTRRAELALWGWDEATCQAFLRGQFAAHQSAYQSPLGQGEHAVAERTIIERGGVACGAMIVRRHGWEWHLADIAVLPAHQKRGVASWAIQSLLSQALSSGASVSLQVWKANPALRLYQRLGFRDAGSSETHFLLRWSAPDEREPESEGNS